MVSAMLRWYLGLKEIRQFIKKKKKLHFLVHANWGGYEICTYYTSNVEIIGFAQ